MSETALPPEQIRRVRRFLRETQSEFAKRLNVDAVTVARWETGQRACKGVYAEKIMEISMRSKLPITKVNPLQGTNEHHFPKEASVFKLICMHCGGDFVHPKLCHLQEDNDDYDGDRFGYGGRGEFMVVKLSCETCSELSQLVLSNHKGDGFLAIYPWTRIDQKPSSPARLDEY